MYVCKQYPQLWNRGGFCQIDKSWTSLMWANLMGSPGSQLKAEGAHDHVTSRAMSFPPISPPPSLLWPPFVLSWNFACTTPLCLYYTWKYIFFLISGFPLGKQAPLVQNGPHSMSWLGPGYHQISGKNTKLSECLWWICHYTFTTFFALQGDILVVVFCKGVKISGKSAHKLA